MRAHTHFGRWDPINISFDLWLCRRLLAGWRPTAIVTAAAGRVSVRTVYRWRRELVRLEQVEVDGWVAWYAIRRTMPPARISPWSMVLSSIGLAAVDEARARAVG